jgi:dUTPase
MENFTLKIKRVGNSASPLPRYMTSHAAGMDLFASLDSNLTLLPFLKGTKPKYDPEAD